jgi:hypothetical protein
LDPNTVAEYLDNTLPSERVTDFEKVCLEANSPMADIHLAEVAACHQVLAIVLGEPAEIDPTVRERMYQLPALAQRQEESGPQARPAHLPPPIPTQPSKQEAFIPEEFSYRPRSKPTVPEYLREPKKKRPWFAIAAGTLAIVCLILVVLNVTKQFEQDSALGKVMVRWGLMSPKPQIADARNTSKNNENATTAQNTENGNSSALEPDAASTKNAPENAVANANPTGNPVGPEPSAGQVNPAPPGIDPNAPLAGEISPVPQNPQVSLPAGEAIPGVTQMPNPGPQVSQPPAVEGQPGNVVPPSDTLLPAGEQPAKASETPTNNGLAVSALPAPANPAAEPGPMGRFTSPEQILLRSKGDSGNWERTPDKTMLYPQQHLLALPTYRPTVTLNSGLILQMLGGTEVTLLPADQQMPAGLKIRYGRIVINSVANAGSQLRLEIGGQVGILTFLDADSNVGIEVRRVRSPGVNPEEEGDRLMTEILVTKDRVSWDDGTGKSLEAASPTQIIIWPQIPPVTDHLKDFPKWISTAESISDIDRRASSVMLQSFTPEVSAQQKLLELADNGTRLIEVRRLAVRSLGYIGYFEPMVAALNDPAYKSDWMDKHFEWLCDAVRRDPQTAAAVREALEKNYGPQAAALYRMLWGYTNNNLMAGEDETLVKNLDDENLAVRVLAICNIKSITDKDLGYRPDAPLPQRARTVKLWEQRQAGKEIRNKQAEKKNAPALPEPPPATLPGS